MSWQQELRDYLSEVGLEDGQLNVYLELLLNNFGVELKASEIAEKVNLNRSYVYEVLSNLMDKGLIATSPGTPKTYSAKNPMQYVNSQLKNLESQIQKYNSLQSLIENDVQPYLQKHNLIGMTQLKQTFIINSLFVLSQYVIQSLLNSQFRILLHVSSQFLSSIEETLRSVDINTSSNRHRNIIRIIYFGKKEEKLLSDISIPIIYSDSLDDNFQIVIDDDVFLFNSFADIAGPMLGVGIMIRDKSIANSYAFSLDSYFRKYYYRNLPKSNLDGTFQVYKENKYLMKALRSLLNLGWNLLEMDYQSDINYLALIAPEIIPVQVSREGGIQYIPFKNKSKEEKKKILGEMFESIKNVSLERTTEVMENMDMKMTYKITKEKIENFDCMVLRFSNDYQIGTKFGSTQTELRSDILNPSSSCSVVFNYFELGGIMAWTLFEENIYILLKELYNAYNH